ncbi:MAG TPA: NADH-quinone oxidoreductase subunit NuoB [Phycisphaerae bacterium]|jgi:Ni,Fe-hydrogenase III small subunit|nr:NADH-quinone oxidoreductase subunit NuoB [Phycisphaerae bacterium]HOB73149.1 NADH-quinone oxidoreductase subunit NuoB [Phycisphaerae bacterium]HOJ53320.1 NADH-quinone oxidoreductase subunit NuoB [Phycisphaerae bacterium]HOL27206.1 NADH-quinone oxidoreductase subunit NuoB [Phycisphaerae bacterium]HPP21766.1 NADH-quinone oxidoreductase subunit NuoB [Phycisphaerae bacterium]
MLNTILARWRQGHRTVPFPKGEPVLPDRLRGLPVLDRTRCPDSCRACEEACPTDAITAGSQNLRMDLGKCLFCGSCVSVCPEGGVRFTQEYRLAVRGRQDLFLTGETLKLAEALDEKMRRLFGRSLKLRQVSAGGCNACEADVNVLNTVVFDLGRFGIQFVASPRHADGLLITGPVTENMRLALEKTYAAVPDPKIVIAVGACAISGGVFHGNPEVHDGAGSVVPVDLYIPGCPPHPITILDGLLRLVGRIEARDPAQSAPTTHGA